MTDVGFLSEEEAHDAIQKALAQYSVVLKRMGAGLMPKAEEVGPAMDMIRTELERLRDVIKLKDFVIDAKEAEKNNAYRERNLLIVVLAKLFPASIELDAIGTDPEWKYVVIVDFPTGQASWHIHRDEINLFSFLPLNAGRVWDGHTTDEKYRRIAELKPKE
jgi:hypothetical protein